MKKSGIILIILFAIQNLSVLHAQTAQITTKPISIAGQWKFKLDPLDVGMLEEWFKTKLSQNIELPGSCEQHGYGIKTTTPAIGRLTRLIKYEGHAWYQKEINVPEAWKDKRVELFLERCHWESDVWIDDKAVGMENSLSVPHLHDLGILKPGKHLLTICIDNTYKIKIGNWSSAITEDTQGNWNGIVGRIELSATNPVWIKNAQVFPSLISVNVGNQTGHDVNVIVQSKKFHIPAGGSIIMLPFTNQHKNWDEFFPAIQSETITLKAEKWLESKTITYGIRDLTTENRQFVMNGRPLMMRGTVDECVYPLTGYPPMDKASWLRVLRICKSYGFNYMRFHSWCPPEAAFEAGDELGFLFQVELPFWTIGTTPFGKDAVRDEFIRNELKLILDTYGNHPSFGFMAMGNESTGSLDELTKIGQSIDSRHIYRCEIGSEKPGDFHEAGQRGILGPRTDWDRWSLLPGWIANEGNEKVFSKVTVPTISHEIGQWCMYPNLKETKKYTGTLRTLNFESYKESLEAHHMLDEAGEFEQSSGKLSISLYKEEIEACLRTYPYGGFQVLEARDYPGQGTAIVGWLDAFWDSKGLITPEEFRRFCAPTVCLMRIPKRILTSTDKFVATAEIAHYGPTAIKVSPEWKINNSEGLIIANGTFPAQNIETGRNTKLGDITAALSKVKVPQKLTVTLSAGGTSNSWEIWIYPETLQKAPANVRIVFSFDKIAKDALAKGENVLLFSSPTEGIINYHRGMFPPDSIRLLPAAKPGQNAITGSFTPVFWNTRLFNQIGTLGILCDPKNPAFAEFPTEEHSNWQWADLLGNFSAANSFLVATASKSSVENMEKGSNDKKSRSKAILLDGTPAGFRPILQIIDNYDRNAKLGTIFETRVGKGKLLVCAMDLETDATNRPAARQLKQSLLDYMAGVKFTPKYDISLELLDKILLP